MLEEDAEYEKRRIDPYSSFDPNLYVKFREQPILKSAIEFAREGKIGAVSSLLSRYPAELNQVTLHFRSTHFNANDILILFKASSVAES